MLRASARLALAHVLLSAQRSKLLIILISILTHLLTFYCLRSYADKKQYFDLQASLSKEANIVAIAMDGGGAIGQRRMGGRTR